MTNTYWSQWSSQEIMSMHGIEEEYEEDEDIEVDHQDEEEQDRCPKCGGGGCNWCLMLDY